MFAQISLKSRKFFGERLMKYFAWKNYLGQLAGGNFLGKIIWRVTIWGLIIRVDNYPVANWPEGSFPWGNCLMAIIRGTIMLGVVVWGRGGAIFPGAIVWGAIIWGQFSRGNCPGNNYLVGNCPRTLIMELHVQIHMVVYLLVLHS